MPTSSTSGQAHPSNGQGPHPRNPPPTLAQPPRGPWARHKRAGLVTSMLSVPPNTFANCCEFCYAALSIIVFANSWCLWLWVYWRLCCFGCIDIVLLFITFFPCVVCVPGLFAVNSSELANVLPYFSRMCCLEVCSS